MIGLLITIFLFIFYILSSTEKKKIVDNRKVYRYTVLDSQLDPKFPEYVDKILANNGWWSKYIILRDDTNYDVKIQLVEDSDTPSLDHVVKDDKGEVIKFSICTHGFDGINIYINYDNWKDGVERSGLTKEQYRRYVILHEFGHALGYDHQKCKNGSCPVMYQATIGPPKDHKCLYDITPEDFEVRLKNLFL